MTEFQIELYNTVVSFLLMLILIAVFVKIIVIRERMLSRLSDEQYFEYLLAQEETTRVKHLSKMKTGRLLTPDSYVILLDEITVTKEDLK